MPLLEIYTVPLRHPSPVPVHLPPDHLPPIFCVICRSIFWYICRLDICLPIKFNGLRGWHCSWIWSWTRRLTRWSMGWPTWCGTWGFRWLALWWMVVEVDKLADNGIVMLLDMEVDKLAQEVAVIWWARGVLLPLMLIHYSDSNDCLGDVGGWAACFGGVLSARRGQEGGRRGRRRWELLLWGRNLVKM